MKEQGKARTSRQHKILDEIFMVFLHDLVERGGTDYKAIRELVPDHLLPWFDANVELKEEHRPLLPLPASVSPRIGCGPDELLAQATPIAKHSTSHKLREEFEQLSEAVAGDAKSKRKGPSGRRRRRGKRIAAKKSIAAAESTKESTS
jgi:hypothetical protein